MNADRLLALYDRIADAPDAIPRLRRFVLDLAVRGKLVPQDPHDEPASDLLRRISGRGRRFAVQGELKLEKQRAIDKIASSFDLPPGWVWARLGEIIHLVSGQHLQPTEYSIKPGSGIPYITGPSDFGPDGLEISRFALVRKSVATRGQLLLTVKGSGVGKATTCDLDEVAISRQLMALTPIDWEMGFLELITRGLAETLQERARSLIPGISREDVKEYVIGLPPLTEQRRIVAKVDELMALCDRLESSITGTDATRRRLLEALLAEALAPADALEPVAVG